MYAKTESVQSCHLRSRLVDEASRTSSAKPNTIWPKRINGAAEHWGPCLGCRLRIALKHELYLLGWQPRQMDQIADVVVSDVIARGDLGQRLGGACR
jgi:hypothetical protein